jgi:hypothetical protein
MGHEHRDDRNYDPQNGEEYYDVKACVFTAPFHKAHVMDKHEVIGPAVI